MSKKAKILSVVAFILAVFVTGCAMAVYRDTIVEWWMPIVVSAIVGIAFTFGISGRVGGFGVDRFIQFAAIFAITAAVTGFGVLAVNRYGADLTQTEETQCEVVRKYSEQHQSGSGRRHSGSWRTYTTWHVGLLLPDGRQKDFQVTLSRYNKIKTGSMIHMTIAPGMLGMPVIVSDEL